jgi:hypothetical protein
LYLGKTKPFLSETKSVSIERNTLDAMEQPLFSPEMHKNSRIQKSFDACNNIGSRSRSTMGASLHMSFDTMFDKTRYFHTGTNTLRNHSHKQIKDQYTNVLRG